MEEYLGKHLIVDFWGCDPERLDDLILIQKSMLIAAYKARATVLGWRFHQFFPQGITGVVVLSESHLSIHTWPELGYAGVDLFTCGHNVDPYEAYEYLKKKLQAENSEFQEIQRGVLRQQYLYSQNPPHLRTPHSQDLALQPSE